MQSVPKDFSGNRTLCVTSFPHDAHIISGGYMVKEGLAAFPVISSSGLPRPIFQMDGHEKVSYRSKKQPGERHARS